ncbi:DUF4266 domain-containing protein [Ideonella sp. A 288]|uniref:DUF4266 domain-containing protein n=1 Tax=Ideonella sp. A 288 TaxID=1962181 RepID=UPI001F372AEE|nr:DUF4266 domain-containing protein [Ideonella sp. A 288]
MSPASVVATASCAPRLIGCGLAALALAGCTAVAPWERGELARPHMAVDPAPMRSALRDHVHSSREAASMGGSADGGGCGCY